MFSDEEEDQVTDAFDKLMQIEFIGGPLDGHCEMFSTPLAMAVCFQSQVTLERTPWLRRLMQKFAGKCSPPFHVAIYDLTLQRERLVYRYSESIVASEPQRLAGKVWLGVHSAGQS